MGSKRMSNYDDRMADYVDVAERIRQFRAAYPEGSLQPANPEIPFKVLTIGDRTFIAYVAAAYRHPDDVRPGIGAAWETFPGKTPYTKDSELQNAESSAWGRAIVAALAADTKKVASLDEVRARKAEQANRQATDAGHPSAEPAQRRPDAPESSEIRVKGKQYGPLPQWLIEQASAKNVGEVWDNRDKVAGTKRPWFKSTTGDVPFWPPDGTLPPVNLAEPEPEYDLEEPF